jgi:hypothetical protein
MPAETRRTTRALQVVAVPLIVTVLAVALAALSVRVKAADDASGSMFMCRPAAAGETSNARMTANSDTALECREVSMKLKMSDGSMRTIGRVTAKTNDGPDLSKALTPQQVNDAWVKWIDAMFHVTHEGG